MNSAPRVFVTSDEGDGGAWALSAADFDGGPVASQFRGTPGMLEAVSSPDGRRIYGVSQVSGGTVHAFGVLGAEWAELNSVPSGGTVPCSLTLSPSGRHLLVANYGSSTVVVLRLAGDGSIGAETACVQHSGSGPVAERQDMSHVHQVRFDPSGRFVVVTDLGTDRIYSYLFSDEDGTLRHAPSWSNPCPPGSGPRHLAFTSAREAVVVDELSSTLSRYSFEASTGQFTWLQRLELGRGSGQVPNYPSEVVLAASKRYAYVANRGADTVAVIDVRPDRFGSVSELPAGKWPLHLAVTSGRLWSACRNSDEVISWPLDRSGLVDGQPSSVRVGSPLCIVPLDSPELGE